MHVLIKRLCLLVIIVGAFYLAGHIGMWMENFHDNLFAGAGIFSVSFLSMMGGSLKAWYHFIA